MRQQFVTSLRLFFAESLQSLKAKSLWRGFLHQALYTEHAITLWKMQNSC
jgi:hypothetical protein